jgi:hypothetical protein
MMRASWIAVGTLAVIGAFFIVLQVMWLLRVDPVWLPYVVHVVGAALAGAAMEKATPMRSVREPLAAGGIAIVALAVVSLTIPNAFVLTAARSDARWLILPAVVCASGIACVGGAWLVAGVGAPPRRGWIGVVAAMTACCAIQLGGRLGFILGVPTGYIPVAIESSFLAFIAGIATQAIVTVEASIAITVGAAAFMALALVSEVSRHEAFMEPALVVMTLPILAAAFGARWAWRARATLVRK